MPKLLLIRHAHSYVNETGDLGSDAPLTPQGVLCARTMSSTLTDKKIEAIYHSPYKRSKETAAVIREPHPQTPLIESEALKEIDRGEMRELTHSEFQVRYPDLNYERENDKYNWQFPCGESYRTLVKRMRPFVEQMARHEGNILVVGHKAVNRCILGILLNLAPQEMLQLSIPHNSIFEVTVPEMASEIYNSKRCARCSVVRVKCTV